VRISGDCQTCDTLSRVRMKAGVARWLIVCALVGWMTGVSAARSAAAQGTSARVVHDQPWQTVSLLDDANFQSVYIFGIDFSADGTAWLATNIGLIRYDGYSWQHFTTADGLPTEFVRSVLVTRRGELWVGTSRGAGAFDPVQRRFDPRGSEAGLAGPSVRRIVEDPDGTIWFCSDRWPDPGVSGGLAMLRDGVWHRFGRDEGITQQYVHNYFRTSHGRQFALTLDGVLERTGDRWEPLREPGFPADARAGWQMEELPNGDLIVQQAGRLLARHNGRWINVPHNRGGMVVTRAGELIGTAEDQARQTLVFQRWTGDAFVNESGETDVQDLPSEMAREAPDGSIWCVGKGILLRWRYGSPTWTAFKGLPPLQGVDRAGRAWFVDASSAWTAGGGRSGNSGSSGSNGDADADRHFTAIPGVHGPLTFTDTGEAWLSTSTGFARFAGDDHTPQPFTHAATGLASIRTIVSDARKRLWFVGYDAARTPTLRVFDGTTWRSPSPSIPHGFDVTMIERDPTDGMWLTLRQLNTTRWVIARIAARAEGDGDALTTVAASDQLPPMQQPRLAVRADSICLYDYTGQYQATDRTLKAWKKLDLPLDGSNQHFTLRDVTWLAFNGWRPDHRGVAAYRDGRWQVVPVDWRGSISSGNAQTLLLPSARGFYLLRNDPTIATPEFVAVPGTESITRVVEDRQGGFWIATNAYVLRYRPDAKTPLRAAVSSAVSEVRSDREMEVAFAARRRYEPHSSETEHLQYSWRLDDGPWTRFLPSESVRLAPGFAAFRTLGKHRLQVRVRDANGAQSVEPAELQFALLPVPLQERRWFWPFIGALGGLLIFTTASAWSARVRLARQARGLEQTVRERTAELEDDIVQRERAEAALRESEQRFKGVFNSAFQLICVLSPDGLVQETNQTALAALGVPREEVIGRTFWDTPFWSHSTAMQARLRDAVERAARGEIIQFESQHPRPDGTTLTVDCSVKAVRDEGGHVRFVIAEGRNITERKQAERDRLKLEAQLRQAQKMEAIGTLAGGIAHDFNNLLTAIFGNAEVAAMEVPSDHPAQENLRELLQAAFRARDLVNQILIFSRRQEQERRPLQLGPIVAEAMKLIRASLPRTIEIETDISAAAVPVLADPIQIHQVVMNLCTNAGHAMRQAGGKLTVSLKPVDVDADFVRLHPKLTIGSYLRLAVCDTGHGIEPETMDRIFEPFFSTKPPGEGTGLGLSVVHGIMANHDGAVTVYSQVGRGTTFHLYFPVVDTTISVARQPPRAIVRGSGECVLVVDDEGSVAEIAGRMLERAGYETVTYTDPVDALQAFGDNPLRFAVVLTDLTMPRLTGLDLAQALRRLRPDLPIVLGSGFSDHLGEQKARQAGISALLLKPYTIQDLAETVHRVLTATSAERS
jgi:PAS domain S-box-containing protein